MNPARRADFASWWHAGTLRIRASREGALGSILLAPDGDHDHLVAVARWRTRADLEAFWRSAGRSSFDGAVLEVTEVFDELDDLTLGEPSPER